MKKAFTYLLLLSVFNCSLAQTSRAQEQQGSTPTQTHKQKAAQLRRQAEREEKLQRVDEILEEFQQAQRADNTEKMKKLREELEGLITSTAPGRASQPEDAQPQATPSPSESPAPTPTPTPTGVTPSTAAAMTGPTEREVLLSTPRRVPKVIYGLLDPTSAELFNPRYAEMLIKSAIDNRVLADARNPPDTKDKNFHCIIHVMRWKSPEQDKPQEVDKQNWYVYNNGRAKGFNGKWSQDDFARQDRIYGVKRIWVLYVHLNKWENRLYKARYDFDITKKTPANLADLFSVAQLFVTGGAENVMAAEGRTLSRQLPEDVWGGGAIDLQYAPSNVTVTAKFVPLQLRNTQQVQFTQNVSGELQATPKDASQGNTGVGNVTDSVTEGPSQALDKPRTYDNEGLYWWDVSVAVPIRKISQLQFNSADTTVGPQKVDRQNIFALLNLYPFPADIKGTTFSWIPHFIGGVAIAKQPQNKILIGASFGPRFANFYLGSLFVKQEEAAMDGSDMTVRRRYKPQFSFGLNLPVRGIVEALKPKEK